MSWRSIRKNVPSIVWENHIILRSQAESGHEVYRVTMASVWAGTE